MKLITLFIYEYMGCWSHEKCFKQIYEMQWVDSKIEVLLNSNYLGFQKVSAIQHE